MANLCGNVLTISGSPAEVAHFVDTAIVNKGSCGRCVTGTFAFGAVVPVNDGIVARGLAWGTTRHGAVNDVDVNEDGSEATISVSTAWAPPKEFVVAASRVYELVFHLSWDEPGRRLRGELLARDGRERRPRAAARLSRLA